MRFMGLGFLLLVVSAAAAACGGSGGGNAGGGNGQSTCQSTFGSLCQRACDCGAGKCREVVIADSGATASLSWPTLQECSNFYSVFVCGSGSGSAPVDYAACSSAVSAASCAQGVDGPGIALPAACNSNTSTSDGGG